MKERGKSLFYSNLVGLTAKKERMSAPLLVCISQVNPICDVGVVRLVNKRSLPKRRWFCGRVRISTIDPVVKHALRRGTRGNSRVRNCDEIYYIIPRASGRELIRFCFVPFNSLERVESNCAAPRATVLSPCTFSDVPWPSLYLERQSVYGISWMHSGSRARACGSTAVATLIIQQSARGVVGLGFWAL